MIESKSREEGDGKWSYGARFKNPEWNRIDTLSAKTVREPRSRVVEGINDNEIDATY